MLEKVKTAYTNYRWLRFAACAVLLTCTSLLYWLSGGFPPWAWRFLFQVVPRLPQLLQVKGAAVLLPLFGLVCLSFALLLLWGAIVAAALTMARYWWNNWQERQHFQRELQEAEHIAEHMVADEMLHMAVAAGNSLEARAAASSAPTNHDTARRLVGAELAAALASPASNNGTPAQSDPVQPIEAWMRGAQVVAPEPVAEQAVERQAQPVPAGVSGQAAQYASPALARGQLRLVPRSDEMDDEEDEIPEIELPQQHEQAGLEVGVGLHPGFHRKDAPNEDALFEIRGTHTTPSGLQHVGLFVVAGGMENTGPGYEASHLAIQALSAVMVPALLSNTKIVFADLLKEGVQGANLALYSRNRELAGMNCKVGTTMTATLVVGPTAYIANVGNSRTYLYQQQQGLTQVTHDHVPAADFLRRGMNTAHKAPAQTHHIVLERYLGRHPSVEVDVFAVSLQTGNVLLLCSDGLWTMVCDTEIAEILGSPTTHPAQMSTMLVQQALNHGGADNISAIVVRYSGSEYEG